MGHAREPGRLERAARGAAHGFLAIDRGAGDRSWRPDGRRRDYDDVGVGPEGARMSSVLLRLVPLVFLAGILWAIVRYGPLRSRWWKGEHPAGFALLVGTTTFLAGFVGPIYLTPQSDQGPLLGIFITGPLGL